MNPVQQAILDRRSNRAYDEAPITREQLDALVQAALASPSGTNAQPWHFSVVQDRALLDQLAQATREEALKTPLGVNPRFQDSVFHVFYHAPLAVFISADPDGKNDIDCGIAVQTLALAAQGLGLGSVILGLPRFAFLGERADEFRKALAFPDGHDFRICIAVGAPKDTKPAHEIGSDKVSYIG